MSVLGLADAPRLVDIVRIEKGWEAAFETVAGQRLQDISVADLNDVASTLPDLETGKAALLLNNAERIRYTPKSHPRLIDKVSAGTPLDAILNRIYVAEDLDQARDICRELDETESVITRDGIWMNSYWVRIHRPAEDTPGMLTREQQLSQLRGVRLELEQELGSLEQAAAEKNGLMDQVENKSSQLLAQMDKQQETATETRARYTEYKTRFEQAHDRAGQIAQELLEIQRQKAADQAEITNLEELLKQDREARKQLQAQHDGLAQSRSEHNRILGDARSRWQAANDDRHSVALQLESAKSQKVSIEHSIKRCQVQLSSTEERIRELETELQGQTGPLQELRESLDVRLAEKVNLEASLTAAREAVLLQEKQSREKEQLRSEREQELQDLRGELEQARIEQQEIKVRVQTVEERLEALGQTPEALLSALDETADKQLWQEKINSTGNRIQRLGAINLAAIEEFEQLSERKNYLDSQYRDLTAALETLEAAIHRIDKETRSRFKETFDRLNANLKESFPLLFGGGHAYLEMTAQDLLETGVTVMARPPGKKNSNIHLLSGGEKALTAVALVFSIFKLNPAPFCILDEVDAPLDDNNVGQIQRNGENHGQRRAIHHRYPQQDHHGNYPATTRGNHARGGRFQAGIG